MSTVLAPSPPRPAEGSDNGAPAFRRTKKRMLIIVNPYATTVSDRLKNLVVYALQGRYDVEAVSTEAQNHATEICREATDGDYDVVVAFGGDGTLNEVANGLAGTGIPVSVLPGGSTNVVCRTLGIPNDIVDATEHLLGLVDDFRPRRVDLGIAGRRRFVFSTGCGLDATAAKKVDAKPSLKTRYGPYFYSWVATSSFYTEYLRDPVRMRLAAGGREIEGITVLAQNSDPFTYFASRPVRVCRDVAIDDGSIAVAVLKRAAQRDVGFVITRLLSERFAATDHRQIEHVAGIVEGRIESLSLDPDGKLRGFPVQVDGDYIGDFTELELGVEPGALTVVA